MTASVPATDADEQPVAANWPNAARTDCGLTVHAVLPPPVTGMTLCTEAVATAIARRVPVRRFNWSNGSARITLWFRVAKGLRAITTPARLLLGRRPRQGVFYMPCNSGLAVFWNVLALSAARLRGYRCVLHHHYYRYLERFQWRIKLLARILGADDLQIVLCPDMEHRLRNLYGLRLPIAIIPSTIQLLDEALEPELVEHREVPPRPFRIGHISNLQMAKGLDTVVDVLRVLRRQGHDVQLVLAGPVQSSVERSFIHEAQREFGTALHYRGPVYGEDKRRFFRDIHAKLFPTRYPDAQPLVIAESFAFARPVLSYGRGCIPGMLGPASDWSIPTSDDFIAPAVRQIEHWINNPASYAEASRIARERFDVLLSEARRSLGEFAEWVCCAPDCGFVRRGTENVQLSSPAALGKP